MDTKHYRVIMEVGIRQCVGRVGGIYDHAIAGYLKQGQLKAGLVGVRSIRFPGIRIASVAAVGPGAFVTITVQIYKRRYLPSFCQVSQWNLELVF